RAARVFTSLPDEHYERPHRAELAGAVQSADTEHVAPSAEQLRVARPARMERRAVEGAAETQRCARREVVARAEAEARSDAPGAARAVHGRPLRRAGVADSCEE